MTADLSATAGGVTERSAAAYVSGVPEAVTSRQPGLHPRDARPFRCGSRGVMETFLAIVAAVVILAVVFLGIFLVAGVIAFITASL